MEFKEPFDEESDNEFNAAYNDARLPSGHAEKNIAWLDPERTATRLVNDDTSVEQLNLADDRRVKIASGHAALPLVPTATEGSNFDFRSIALNSEASGDRSIHDKAMDYMAPMHLVPFGADRNGNGRFDKGKVPKNRRLQAEVVARFNFYDPVMWMSLGR